MAYQIPYGIQEGYVLPNSPGMDGKPAFDQAKHLLEGAKQYLLNQQVFEELKQQLEGPKPLRVIAGLGGLALALTSAIGLLNIFTLITHPAQFILEVYETLFGLLITVIELKAFFKPGHKLRDFSYRWFPFLTIIGGKGAFYIFTGSLGLGFGLQNLLIFIPASFVIAIGVIYVLFHFGQCKSLRDKYDQVSTPQTGTQWIPSEGNSPPYCDSTFSEASLDP